LAELIGKTLGHYRILEIVGQGGMATVYKAEDLSNEKICAVKVMLPILGRDEGLKKRFRQEARVLSRLQHPNIVPILSYGEENGHLYYVLPYMPTGSLSDRLASGQLSMEETALIISQSAAALQHAHDEGVIHRDVKPSNILLDEDGNAQLSDFGFAYWSETTLSMTGSGMVGTPGYMSPEQCLGEGVTELSDQYSLAVVLFRLVVCRVPFEGETPLAIALKHINEPLPRPRDVNQGVPIPIEDVLITALAKNPKDRFGSIALFNDALQDAILLSVKNGYEPTAVMRRPNRFIVAGDRFRRRVRALFSGPSLRRWPVFLGVLGLLLAFPLGAFALRGTIGDSRNQMAENQDALAYDATISALYTANAPINTEDNNPGQVQTAVAGTLSVLETQAAREGTATPVSTSWSLLNLFSDETSTSTPTATIWYYLTHTPTENSGSGSSHDSPTPTPTPTPTNTPTPTPTATSQEPTSTQASEPTPTPKPVNPSACNDKVGHPNYCTPTPDS
jgi:serine/threonine protein kinase